METLDISSVYHRLINGDETALNDLYANKSIIQNYSVQLLEMFNNGTYTSDYNGDLDTLMRIFNIIYNNFDAEPLIDDGIYDMMMNMYKTIFPNYQVGADFVPFNYESQKNNMSIQKKELYCPFNMIDETRKPVDQWLFKEQLFNQPQVNPAYYSSDSHN